MKIPKLAGIGVLLTVSITQAGFEADVVARLQRAGHEVHKLARKTLVKGVHVQLSVAQAFYLKLLEECEDEQCRQEALDLFLQRVVAAHNLMKNPQAMLDSAEKNKEKSSQSNKERLTIQIFGRRKFSCDESQVDETEGDECQKDKNQNGKPKNEHDDQD